MGRKRAPAPPKQPGDAWHLKLARLVDRKARGRTDAEIARAAGISPTYFGLILKAKAPEVSMATVLAILAQLDATLCDLDRA